MVDSFNVFVAKDYFKFTAAHFIAFKGFRELLHGHNYTTAVRLHGNCGEDGYVMDFGHVKGLVKSLCKSINQKVLIPINSDVLEFEHTDENLAIRCEDGSFFSFPKSDCAILPLVHSSAEELAEFLLDSLISKFKEEFGEDYLPSRGITRIEFSVSEAKNQTATCSRDMHDNAQQNGTYSPKPCLDKSN